MDTQERVEDYSADSITALTADIVSAFVGYNAVRASELPSLIASVHTSLAGLGNPVVEAEPDMRATAAQIRKSVTPDALISFVDGKPYKSLRRHLGTHGLTPDAYRSKYGLSQDYPMVSSNYASARSELAKKSGLGQKRNKHAQAAAAENDAVASEPKRRGRPKKSASA